MPERVANVLAMGAVTDPYFDRKIPPKVQISAPEAGQVVVWAVSREENECVVNPEPNCQLLFRVGSPTMAASPWQYCPMGFRTEIDPDGQQGSFWQRRESR